MSKLEPLVDERGNRYLNLEQAAAQVCGVSALTLRYWAEKGKTSFGFPLDLKRIPVTKHRYVRLGGTPTAKPLKERILISERNIGDLNEILASIGPVEPGRRGSWTEFELATMEAKATAVLRRKQEPNLHL